MNIALSRFCKTLFLGVSVFAASQLAAGHHESKAKSMPTSEQHSEKKQWIHYVESGQYDQELQAVVEDAKQFLKEQIQLAASQKGKNKLAVVFDIDETVLSNFENMRRLHFTKNKEAIVIAYAQAKDPAIKPTKELYDFAKENGVTIFFVTGRANSEEVRESTVRNLHTEGFYGWKTLYLRPLDDEKPSAIPFKTETRKKIESLGYTIVLNVGDQQSDLEGGYAMKGVKLPNPFYTLP